jgi:hypothetical protein
VEVGTGARTCGFGPCPSLPFASWPSASLLEARSGKDGPCPSHPGRAGTGPGRWMEGSQASWVLRFSARR